MSCSYCRNPEHNIRSCDSADLHLIYQRLKTAANGAIANIARVNQGYNEAIFINELNHLKLPELKAACIHWKRFCDPEVLADNDIPEIKSNLGVRSYVNIAVWLYIYIENKNNETFLAHSSDLSNIYKGCWIASRLSYWFNIGIRNFSQNHARTIFMNRVEEYYRVLTQYRALYYGDQDQNNGQPREPRKFQIVANVCQDIDISYDECPICYEDLNNETKVRNHCGHSICVGCFEKYLVTMIPKTSDPCCSVCRCVINKVEVGANDVLDIITKYTL